MQLVSFYFVDKSSSYNSSIAHVHIYTSSRYIIVYVDVCDVCVRRCGHTYILDIIIIYCMLAAHT